MVIPFGLLFFFISVLLFSQITTGEMIQRDITLKGGTAITIYTHEQLSLDDMAAAISSTFSTTDVVVRRLMDATQQNILGYDIQVGVELTDSSIFEPLGNALGLDLNSENTSIAIQSSTIAESFFQDAVVVIAIAFILMSLVVFYYFRNPIPAGSIILSTVSDIICMLGLMSLLNVKLSIATVGAFLMIIGYSTDSDILLATYILKRKEGSLMDRIKHGIKIELTVDTASYVVYLIMFVLSNIEIIKHIAFVMLFATMFDVINTWIQNAGLQRMYLERRDKR
jgi:preprotein translocase subunit SecF